MRVFGQQLFLCLLCASNILAAPSSFSPKKLSNLDLIGKRDVAHRSIISSENEAAIGKLQSAQFESCVELVQDPFLQSYLASLAEKVYLNSDYTGPIFVKIVKSSEVNSMSIPGGYIYLTSGLLSSAENEDEFVGTIAHQVAHAAARHWASEMTKASLLQFAMVSMMMVPICPAGTTACAGLSSQQSLAQSAGLISPFGKFQRKDELEADFLGLQYVYKSGCDPRAYLALLRRATPSGAATKQADAMSGIPPLAQRNAQAEKEINLILPNAPAPRSSPEFIQMKASLQDALVATPPPGCEPHLRRSRQ